MTQYFRGILLSVLLSTVSTAFSSTHSISKFLDLFKKESIEKVMETHVQPTVASVKISDITLQDLSLTQSQRVAIMLGLAMGTITCIDRLIRAQYRFRAARAGTNVLRSAPSARTAAWDIVLALGWSASAAATLFAVHETLK